MCVGGSGAADALGSTAAPDTPTHHPHVPTPSLTRPGLASTGARHGVTNGPVHHLHLPHDQPHPPYLALCPPLVAADRPKNPAKLIEESSERLQESGRRDSIRGEKSGGRSWRGIAVFLGFMAAVLSQ